MTKTVRINATMDAELLEKIDAYAASRLEDRSTAIRQLVDWALREGAKSEAVQAYRDGRVTLREFAGILRLDIWRAQDLLLAEGTPIAQGGRAETSGDLDVLVSELGR